METDNKFWDWDNYCALLLQIGKLKNNGLRYLIEKQSIDKKQIPSQDNSFVSTE